MGDVRFTPAYERVAGADDPAAAIRGLPDEGVIAALAAASRGQDPFLANVLATEAQNRLLRWRAALENLGEGVCCVDAQERITYLNPTARRLLGWREGDPLGTSLHGTFHGYDERGMPIPAGACAVADALRAQKPRRCETETVLRLDGTRFDASYTAAPLVREGEAVGTVLVFSDITERKRTEAALRESEERWRALSDAAFEAIFVHDGRHVLDANRAACELFGVSPADARGCGLLEHIHPASQERVLEAIRNGSREPYVAQCLRSDGTTFTAEVMGRPIHYHGRPARVVALREVKGDAT